MSAFIVSEETMHRAVAAFIGMKNFPLDTGTEIGRLLFTMNCEAFRQRYDGRHAESMSHSPASTYEYQHRPSTPTELFKALQCLRYQCCEGDVTESALYKDVEAQCGDIAEDIVMDTDSYAAAPWDF